MPEPEDPLPALIAELDQLLMVAPQIARLAEGWFSAFKAEGLSERHAIYLTACQLHQTPGSAP